MIRFILFLWWRLNPPLNIRVFRRTLRRPTGVEMFDLHVRRYCFDLCSSLEQQFLLLEN